MRLEDEISQSKFRNLRHKAMVNLFYTQNYLINVFSEKTKPFGLTRQQYNVLRILRGQHPKSASINLIKDRMLDKMSDASRMVERMRLKGLVERAHSSADKRAVDVTITAKGLTVLEEMDAIINGMEDKLLGQFAEQDLEFLNNLLDKIRN